MRFLGRHVRAQVIAPQVMLPFLTEAENKALEVYENSTHGLTPEARAIWMPRTLTWHPSVIKYIISEAQANGCDGILANATLQKRLKVRPLRFIKPCSVDFPNYNKATASGYPQLKDASTIETVLRIVYQQFA